MIGVGAGNLENNGVDAVNSCSVRCIHLGDETGEVQLVDRVGRRDWVRSMRMVIGGAGARR